MPALPAPPLDTPLNEPDPTGQSRLPPIAINKRWFQWLSNLGIGVDKRAERLSAPKQLTGQAASIGTTGLPLPSVSRGLYRVSYYARITTPASTSSSLEVTLSWTDGSIALSQTFAAITGNTTATSQSGTLFVRSDAAAPLSYATTYSSSGATPMQYRLDITVELVAAETV